jgi:hypothetical protein
LAIREIASPTSRYTNLFGKFACMVEQQHPQSSLARDARAEQACGTSTDHHDIKLLHALPNLFSSRCREFGAN